MNGLRLRTEDDAMALVRPELGGGLAAWRVRERDLLRAAPRTSGDPFELACFPLVPFSNRIAAGRFDWRGRSVRLAPNWPPHPHPLHGFGWRAAWRVIDLGLSHVVLEHRHASPEWPWTYRCRQRIALEGEALFLGLRLENLGDEPMPAGLGQHPYFPRPAGTTFRADVREMWRTDAEGIPDGSRTRAEAARIRRATNVDDCVLDNVFGGWDGRAWITWPDGAGLEVGADPAVARFLTIYAPPERDFFCLEPVSHVTDAVNRAEGPDVTGIVVLQPGAALELDVVLRYLSP